MKKIIAVLIALAVFAGCGAIKEKTDELKEGVNDTVEKVKKVKNKAEETVNDIENVIPELKNSLKFQDKKSGAKLEE